jgi:hypothetical protein
MSTFDELSANILLLIHSPDLQTGPEEKYSENYAAGKKHDKGIQPQRQEVCLV